jgi:hypothetical protein
MRQPNIFLHNENYFLGRTQKSIVRNIFCNPEKKNNAFGTVLSLTYEYDEKICQMVHQDIERHYYVFHESKNDSDHFSLKLLCKMVLIPAFLFVIYLRSISTIQCPSCMDILVNTTNASLPVDKSFCELTSESSSICKSELFVELIDDYPAMISYMTGPTNALVVGNGDSELTRTINIPLDIGNLYASVIYDCL